MSSTAVPKFYMAYPDRSIVKMMTLRGFELSEHMKDSEFIMFPGGADINPLLYGQKRHKTTIVNLGRDIHEVGIIKRCSKEQYKIGICRGAQLLNVIIGNGAMYQDVDGHRSAHLAYDTKVPGLRSYRVSSTHHQMMIPGPFGDVLLAARSSARKETDKHMTMYTTEQRVAALDDPEIIVYPADNTLCFQYHPEYESATNDGTELFFTHLSSYCLSRQQDESLRARAEKPF